MPDDGCLRQRKAGTAVRGIVGPRHLDWETALARSATRERRHDDPVRESDVTNGERFEENGRLMTAGDVPWSPTR